MSLLYSVVSRGNVVLARYAACAGNFHEVSQVVLAKVCQASDGAGQDKMSLKSGEHMYHYMYDPSSGLIFLCISEESFPRAAAFAFLSSVRAAFDRDYGPAADANSRARTAIPFAMNTDFSAVMAAEMRRHSRGKMPLSAAASDVADAAADDGAGGDGDRVALLGDEDGERDAGDPDKIDRLKEDLRQVRDIMVANIDSIVERGERLELLVDKTEALSSESVTFRRGARQVQRKMWWQNTKMKVILALVVLVIIYGIVSASCGGPLWPKCV